MGAEKDGLKLSDEVYRNEDVYNSDHHHTSIAETITECSIRPKRVVDSMIRKITLLSLIFLSTFMAYFPEAGLGPVLGTVANDLNDTKNMIWYFTVFSLSTAISQLLGVKISDCLGRRRILLTSTMMAFVGSLACGFAVNSKMFIAFRVVQGLATGTNVTLSSAVLVDLFDMKERLKYQSIINAALGVSSIAGPLLSSVLADYLSWRYIFWITAIVFVLVHIGYYFLVDIPLRLEQTLSKENMKTLIDRIDPIGCFLVTAGLSLFLMAMYLGSVSSDYTWSSPLVISFFIGFAVLILLFLAFERFITPHPLFPSLIILDINLILCYIQQFVLGWQFILADLLIFIQYQSVYNLTPTEASLRILPPSIVHTLATILSGRIAYKLENPKAVAIAGNIISVIGVILLIFVQKVSSNAGVQIASVGVYGIGLGFTCVSAALCCQMILEKKAPDLVATSSGLSRCFLHCGLTLSTAFVLSLVQSQTIDDLTVLQNSKPDVYRDIVASGAAYDYNRVRDVRSDSVKQILNVMYFENIRNIEYSFLGWSIVSLLAVIIARIPSIPKKSSDERSENN